MTSATARAFNANAAIKKRTGDAISVTEISDSVQFANAETNNDLSHKFSININLFLTKVY